MIWYTLGVAMIMLGAINNTPRFAFLMYTVIFVGGQFPYIFYRRELRILCLDLPPKMRKPIANLLADEGPWRTDALVQPFLF